MHENLYALEHLVQERLGEARARAARRRSAQLAEEPDHAAALREMRPATSSEAAGAGTTVTVGRRPWHWLRALSASRPAAAIAPRSR